MELTFRKAARDDLEAIVRLYDHTHDAEEAGLAVIGWQRGVYPVRETAVQAFDRDDMYVAEADGEIVASGIINQIQVDVYADCDWSFRGPDDDVYVLHTLVVEPESAGSGIGSAFVRYYEDLAREAGCPILRIDTNAKNVRARKLYAGLGYREAGIVPTVFNGLEDVDLVMMEKYIGR